MKETSTITKCATKDCEKPGTHHANHANASWYCEEHGICAGCGLSVERFEHVIDHGTTDKGHQWSLDAWLCPCVADRRRTMETQRAVYEPKAVVELPKKKTPKDYWSVTV